MKFIRFFIFALLISTPLLAQTSAGGGANPPAPKGSSPGGETGEEPVPIDDYIPLFFIVGISLGVYYMSKSQSVVK